MRRIILAATAATAAIGAALAPGGADAAVLDFEGLYEGDTYELFGPSATIQQVAGVTARAFGTTYVVDGAYGPYDGDSDFGWLSGANGLDLTADAGGTFDLLSFGAMGYGADAMTGTLYYSSDGITFQTFAFTASALTTFAPDLSGLVRAVFLGGDVRGGVDDIVLAAPAEVPLPAGAALLAPALLGAWTARRRAAG